MEGSTTPVLHLSHFQSSTPGIPALHTAKPIQERRAFLVVVRRVFLTHIGTFVLVTYKAPNASCRSKQRQQACRSTAVLLYFQWTNRLLVSSDT